MLERLNKNPNPDLLSLYFEMKDFYAAIGRGLVTTTGEIILPDSGEVTDVADKGMAVVENFLTKEPQPA